MGLFRWIFRGAGIGLYTEGAKSLLAPTTLGVSKVTSAVKADVQGFGRGFKERRKLFLLRNDLSLAAIQGYKRSMATQAIVYCSVSVLGTLLHIYTGGQGLIPKFFILGMTTLGLLSVVMACWANSIEARRIQKNRDGGIRPNRRQRNGG